MTINEYRDKVLKYFYLGTDDITIHRACDGYHNRYKKGDIVSCYSNGKQKYPMIHLPKTRKSIKRCHLLCLLRGISIPEGSIIDHIDGDVFNDKRDNLRIITQAQNNKNRCKRSDNTSGITGIRWSDYHKHYVIRKTVNGKRISRSRKTLKEAKKVLQELQSLDLEYTKRHGK